MVDVGQVLVEQVFVHRLAGREVVVVLAVPLVQVLHDVFEVPDAVLRSAHVVVAEVLGQRRGIERVEYLLLAVAVDRVAGVRADEVVEPGLLLFGSLGVGQVGVEPLHGVLVVETHAGRHHADAALVVAGLCHVVEAGVVHDRVGRAVFLRERRRAERIDGNGRRRSHVVHEAQAVSDLVREDVAQGAAHDRVGDVHRADVGVGGCGLQEAPAVQEFDDVVVHHHRRRDDLARAGIVPRGAHGVLERQRGVADAGVFQVVGIELGVLLRGGVVADLDDVLEADLLEGVVPLFDTLAGVGFPRLGEVRVEVEDDGFHRLDQLAALISLDILGLHAPVAGVVDGQRAAVHVRREAGLARHEDVHARVGDARTHLLLGEQQQRAGDEGREGALVLDLADHRAVRVGYGGGVAQVALDGHVVLESLDVAQMAVRLLERRGAREGLVAEGAVRVERRQIVVVLHEEVRHVDHHGRRVGVVGFDLEGAVDARDRGAAHRFVDALVLAVAAVNVVDQAELHALVALLGEGHVQRVFGLVAHYAVVVVAGLRNGRSEQHLAAEDRHRQLEVELLAIDLVDGHEALDGLTFLALEELVVVGGFFDGGGVRLFRFRFFLVLALAFRGLGCQQERRDEQRTHEE